MMTLLRIRAARRINCTLCPMLHETRSVTLENEDEHPAWPTTYPTKFYATPDSPADREVLWWEAVAWWDDEREYPDRMMREAALAERDDRDAEWDEYKRTHSFMADELKIPKKRGRPKNNPG